MDKPQEVRNHRKHEIMAETNKLISRELALSALLSSSKVPLIKGVQADMCKENM
jgi:hypothetical protein